MIQHGSDPTERIRSCQEKQGQTQASKPSDTGEHAWLTCLELPRLVGLQAADLVQDLGAILVVQVQPNLLMLAVSALHTHDLQLVGPAHTHTQHGQLTYSKQVPATLQIVWGGTRSCSVVVKTV